MFIHIHNHDSWLPEHMTHGGALIVEDFTGDVASPRDYVIYWYEIWSNTLIGCEPPFSTHAARTIRKIDRCVHWKLYLRSRARPLESIENVRENLAYFDSLWLSRCFSAVPCLRVTIEFSVEYHFHFPGLSQNWSLIHQMWSISKNNLSLEQFDIGYLSNVVHGRIRNCTKLCGTVLPIGYLCQSATPAHTHRIMMMLQILVMPSISITSYLFCRNYLANAPVAWSNYCPGYGVTHLLGWARIGYT